MRTSATYSLVWNRLHKDSGNQLVQVRVHLPDGTHKYVSTDVRVPASQWDNDRREVVSNTYSARMNKQIQDVIQKIRSVEVRLADRGLQITSADIDAALSVRSTNGDFIAFCENDLGKRELAGGVRYLHKRAIANIKAAGVRLFADLTYTNIDRFDKSIKKHLAAQTSVYKQHAVIKYYIHLAQKHGLMDNVRNPYATFDVPRGKSRIRTRLDDTEIEKMQAVDLTDRDHIICRDMYLFQVYTGLSYTDLVRITDENIRRNSDGLWIEGLRKKSGEFYTVYLIPEAVEIWQRYGGVNFPAHPSYTQNRLLKVVSAAAGIKKNLTSHTARHSAASWMLRKGVPLAVIQQILGHSDIATTQIYSRLERETIKDEMKRLTFSKQAQQQDSNAPQRP